MADLYLCGKDTGLIPLFDVGGTQIDCIQPTACSGPNRKLGGGGCVQIPSSGASTTTSPPRRPSFTAFKPSSVYASKFSVKDIGTSSQRAPSRESRGTMSADSDGLPSSDQYQSGGGSSSTKAGLFGLPTYAVVGGVAVIGIAAFFMITAKEKKA